ncbi:signal recognition particle, SRP19 subunit [Gigaspora margarita]|uniref:Signal recognition particle, SRP19 subunit n=1 Tax=Gigaspora margarita TaxID=4874 RepID=A0A8H3X047_GIGMA|nr:signal recognition particle, SRP19 subunit [Gigaspora margarita]
MPKGKKQNLKNPMLGTFPPPNLSLTNMEDDPPDFDLPEVPPFTKIATDDSAYKTWVCLYPVYFDSTKTHQEGRRVVRELAVPNPLAKDLAESIKILGLSCVFEPHKTHPRNWINPGRVRVQLFNEQKIPLNNNIPTRKELIKQAASVLSEVQKNNPQQFPPSHSPAISRGILKEGKSNDSGSTASSSTSVTGQAASGSGSNTSTASPSKKKGRKGRK